MSKKNDFYERVFSIFDLICNQNTKDFAKLFTTNFSEYKLKNRIIYLKGNWLNKNKNINPRFFIKDYNRYKFSKLTIDGKEIFKDGEEFLNIDLEEFINRIKIYNRKKSKINEDMFYKYLYTFKSNIGIHFYEIKYKYSKDESSINIKVISPQQKNRTYNGILIKKKNKLIFNFESNNDYITIIFNTDLIYSKTKYLVGIGVEITDSNEKIPTSKKVILTKEKINTKDINLYLTLNETETLFAEENSYEFRNENKNSTQHHLEKYIKKIDNINILLKNFTNQNLYSSFYKQLLFKEFNAINNMFQKLKEHRPYYTYYRKRILNTILQTHNNEKFKKLYIVMPINRYENIFNQQSVKIINLQEKLYELSKNVDIKIIFIIENCKEEFSFEFKSFLKRVNKNIRIYFTNLKNIENEVNSIDFIFTDKQNFSIKKPLRFSKPIFNIILDKTIIEESEITFNKIKNRSITYSQYIENGSTLCKEEGNPTLKYLIGDWHHYTYGSYIQKDKSIKFWKNKVTINSSKNVEYFRENEKIAEGEIIIKKNRSIIFLTKISTQRNIILTFDNYPHQLQDAFIVKVISKQLIKERDIFTIGIMSKIEIPIQKAKDILGCIDKIRLLEDSSIYSRLNSYLIEKIPTNKHF